MKIKEMFALTLSLVIGGFMVSEPAMAGSDCSRECLEKLATRYMAAMVGHRPQEVPIAEGATVRENTKLLRLADSKWSTVTGIESREVFADPLTENVVARVGATSTDNKTVYISTRLKVAAGKITEVETSFDDSPRVVAENIKTLDPVFLTLVPASSRMTREALSKIVSDYFQSLSDHKPNPSDYDPRCDRWHSGFRITHNANNGIENGGDLGCRESVSGNPPWGPATEQRLAVIDPERGIVVGYTLLLYRGSGHQMFVSEVFKILDGHIRLIDNIGINGSDMTTAGFGGMTK